MPLEHWDFLRHDFGRILGPLALDLQLEQIPFVRCTPIKLNEKHIEQFRENNFRDSVFWQLSHLPHFGGILYHYLIVYLPLSPLGVPQATREAQYLLLAFG